MIFKKLLEDFYPRKQATKESETINILKNLILNCIYNQSVIF